MIKKALEKVNKWTLSWNNFFSQFHTHLWEKHVLTFRRRTTRKWPNRHQRDRLSLQCTTSIQRYYTSKKLPLCPPHVHFQHGGRVKNFLMHASHAFLKQLRWKIDNTESWFVFERTVWHFDLRLGNRKFLPLCAIHALMSHVINAVGQCHYHAKSGVNEGELTLNHLGRGVRLAISIWWPKWFMIPVLKAPKLNDIYMWPPFAKWCPVCRLLLKSHKFPLVCEFVTHITMAMFDEKNIVPKQIKKPPMTSLKKLNLHWIDWFGSLTDVSQPRLSAVLSVPEWPRC